MKFFWNADYGHLSFTSDHNRVENCDGYGSGDAVIYPGASPQTGEFRDEAFYPEERFNTVIKKCDLHGSAMGYSGSMGNSVRVTKNNFYGNANGLTTDTISAPGHPGFPADGMKVDHNMFYSNNLDIYGDEDLPFVPLVPQAVGTGIMWPGHEQRRVLEQHGVRQLAVRDVPHRDPRRRRGRGRGQRGPRNALSLCRPGRPGFPVGVASTSCDNRYHDNVMGQVPKGFKPHPALDKFGNQSGLLDADVPKKLPNGLDHYWDEYLLSDGNCWYDNTGPDGTRDSLTADPPLPPSPGHVPDRVPAGDVHAGSAGKPRRTPRRPRCCSSASASGRAARRLTAPAPGSTCRHVPAPRAQPPSGRSARQR